MSSLQIREGNQEMNADCHSFLIPFPVFQIVAQGLRRPALIASHSNLRMLQGARVKLVPRMLCKDSALEYTEASGEWGCLGTNPGLGPYSSLASSGLLLGVYVLPGPCHQDSYNGLSIFLGVTMPPLSSSSRRWACFLFVFTVLEARVIFSWVSVRGPFLPLCRSFGNS